MRTSNFSLMPRLLMMLAILLIFPPTLSCAEDALWTKIEGLWKEELEGFFGSIAINPNNTRVVYIGNRNGGGIYKTVDGGDRWIEINSGLPQLRFTSNYFPISTLLIDPSSSNTLYAGISTPDPYSIPGLAGRGVYKSVDAGMTWWETNGSADNTLPKAPGGILPIFTISIDPKRPDTLYAGLRFRGIWKSTDGGNNWTEINNGLYEDPMRGLDIDGLAVDPVNTNVIYAAGNVTDIFEFGPISQGIYKSIDAGNSWLKLDTGTIIKPVPYTALVSSLAVNPNNTSVIYFGTTSKGIYKSVDAGTTWSEANGVGNNKLPKNPLGYLPIKCLVIDPLLPDTIYAGLISGGVYKSVNGGTNWLPFNDGLNNTTVNTLAFTSNSSSHMLYTATTKGIFSVNLSGDVRGYVKDSTTNQPISEALIKLYHEDGNYTGKYAYSKSPNGHFKIRNVPVANYYLTITKSGYSSIRDPKAGTFYVPTTQEEQGVPEEYWGLNRGDVYLTALLPKPVITSSLQILESPPFHVGDTITSVFTIINKGEAPITFDVVTVGGRGPEGETDVQDFDWHHGITLNANESYDYRGNLTLNKPGKYHLFPTYRTPDGNWNSSVPAEEGITRTLDIEVTTPYAHEAKIKIKDKSIIKGEIQQEKIKIKTKYGEMDIPVENFISIIGQLIKLKDGTTLKGNFAEKTLNVKTDYGRLKVQTKNIDFITFAKEEPLVEPLAPSEEKIPIPEYHGVYLVSEGKFVDLKETKIQAAGTLLKSVWGIKNLSGVDISDKKAYIISYGDILPELVQLAKLKYVDKMKLEDPVIEWLGKSLTNVNMWIADEDIRLKVAPIEDKKNMYRLVPVSPLSPGVYAIHFGNLYGSEPFRMVYEVLDFTVSYEKYKQDLETQAQKQYKFEEKRYGGIMWLLELDRGKLPAGISPREVLTKNIDRIKKRIKAYEDPNVENIFIYRQGETRIRIQTMGGFRNPQRLMDLIGKTGHLEFKLIDEKGDLNKALKGELPPDDEILYDSRGRPYLVKKEALFREEMVKDGEVAIDQGNQPYVVVKLNPEGTEKLSEITAKQKGERLAIILDNVIKSAPVIKTTISSGRLYIQADLTEEEAQDIATIIKSGSLVSPVSFIQNTLWGGDAASGFSRGYVFHVRLENPIPMSSFRDLREALGSKGIRWSMVQRYGKKKDNLYMIWIDLRGITAEIEKEAKKEAASLAQKISGSTEPLSPNVQRVLKEEALAKILSGKIEEILKNTKGQIRSVSIIGQVKGELERKLEKKPSVEKKVELGIVKGRAVDALSNDPVWKIRIVVDGKSTIKYKSRTYHLTGIKPGSYTLRAAAPNYYDFTKDIEVEKGENIVDIPMKGKEIPDLHGIVVFTESKERGIQLEIRFLNSKGEGITKFPCVPLDLEGKLYVRLGSEKNYTRGKELFSGPIELFWDSQAFLAKNKGIIPWENVGQHLEIEKYGILDVVLHTPQGDFKDTVNDVELYTE